MFPNPKYFSPAADVVIAAVALIAKLYRNDQRFTRRWRSPASPCIRGEAWARRIEAVQRLRVRIERRIDLTELSSRGWDDGLPSRQQTRLRGMRVIAEQSANTLRHILRTCEVEDPNSLWDLITDLECAADRLDALAYGEIHATH